MSSKGSSLTPSETIEEMKKRRAETADLRQREAAELVADAELLQIAAEAQVMTAEHATRAWKNFCQALGTDPKAVKSMNKQSSKRGLVNLAYLATICGCELDLYGFCMAWRGYWDMNQIFIKIMCIVMPVGYMLAAAMYMYYASAVRDREQERERQEKEGDAERGSVQLTYVSSKAPPKPQDRSETGPRNSKQPITMQYYHFLPVFRFYLVVKDKEVDDIEALFRVNSLSSFSLGFAQIVGIIFSGLETDWDLDLFTWINVCSQIINWTITLMYFMTEVSAKMGAAMKVDALIYNSEKRLKRKWELYLQCVNQSSENSSTDSTEALFSFERNIDREIQLLANVKETDLTPFIMKDKFEALKFLHRHMNNIYANI